MVPNSSIIMVEDRLASDIIGSMNSGIDSCFYRVTIFFLLLFGQKTANLAMCH